MTPLSQQVTLLLPLVLALKEGKNGEERLNILRAFPLVKERLSSLPVALEQLLPVPYQPKNERVLLSLLAIGQYESLFPDSFEPYEDKVEIFYKQLEEIDSFYESIGGLVGYHYQVLKLLLENEPSTAQSAFSRAEGIQLDPPSDLVEEVILEGLTSLPELAEIYPIGGLGARMNLVNTHGEPLPAACLPFGGRTLLEGLIRDVQAREFVYHRLWGKQVEIPLALMTSVEKNNQAVIESLCEINNWFHRRKENFFIFSQLSVPVITHEGRWSVKGPLELNLQPGGHGALWRTAEERGVFQWFLNLGKERLLIRQINNPIAGLDASLLALTGVGKRGGHTLGFASCERVPYAAEGVLVLKETQEGLSLSNIEYTEFQKFGLEDKPAPNGYSLYPANTNILYIDLKKVLPVVKANPLPGLILNMKSEVPYRTPEGTLHEVKGGRLESMMQNISDALVVKRGEPLPTFLTYNARKKTISVTKRCFEEGKKLSETPEGAFYDLLLNGHTLLEKECGMSLPPFCVEEEYLEKGPNFIFLYHPALGPLYSLISQKIKGGSGSNGSELQLEIADVILENLTLQGSLIIEAENPLGKVTEGFLQYGHETGKCVLKGVTVKNRGRKEAGMASYWKNQQTRQGALKIVLEGHSEFIAEGILFEGNWQIKVPHGERWRAKQGEDGKISFEKEAPSWRWSYRLQGRNLLLGT